MVRRANAGFNAGDATAWVEAWAPEAELRDLANAPDQASVVRGPDAIREVAELWASAFDEFSADIEEYIDAGDFVICAVRWHGEGKASGVALDQHQFDACSSFEAAQIVKGTMGFKTEAEALEAAGLSE